MKLATADEVLARMNLTGTIGSTNTTPIDSALDAATNLLESILRTPLSDTERVDHFSYSRSRFDGYTPITLWLTQGFIDGGITVHYSEDGTRLPKDLTGVATLSEEDYVLDKDKGKLTILATIKQGVDVLAVSYRAGYKEQSRYIPEWMKEAAITVAVFLYRTQGVECKKDSCKDLPRTLSGTIYSIVNEYIITPYEGDSPIYSLVS